MLRHYCWSSINRIDQHRLVSAVTAAGKQGSRQTSQKKVLSLVFILLWKHLSIYSSSAHTWGSTCAGGTPRGRLMLHNTVEPASTGVLLFSNLDPVLPCVCVNLADFWWINWSSGERDLEMRHHHRLSLVYIIYISCSAISRGAKGQQCAGPAEGSVVVCAFTETWVQLNPFRHGFIQYVELFWRYVWRSLHLTAAHIYLSQNKRMKISHKSESSRGERPRKNDTVGPAAGSPAYVGWGKWFCMRVSPDTSWPLPLQRCATFFLQAYQSRLEFLGEGGLKKRMLELTNLQYYFLHLIM